MIMKLIHRTSGECRAMVRFVVKVTTDPTRRFVLFWNVIGWGLSAIFMVLGAGYAVSGRNAQSAQALRLLSNLEGGSVHFHGYVLMILALAISHGLGGNYTRSMHWALRLATFYCLVTALLIFGGWWIYQVDFGAPWWYLFAAFIAASLQAFAPLRPPPPSLLDEVRSLEGSGRA